MNSKKVQKISQENETQPVKFFSQQTPPENLKVLSPARLVKILKEARETGLFLFLLRSNGPWSSFGPQIPFGTNPDQNDMLF